MRTPFKYHGGKHAQVTKSATLQTCIIYLPLSFLDTRHFSFPHHTPPPKHGEQQPARSGIWPTRHTWLHSRQNSASLNGQTLHARLPAPSTRCTSNKRGFQSLGRREGTSYVTRQAYSVDISRRCRCPCTSRRSFCWSHYRVDGSGKLQGYSRLK